MPRVITVPTPSGLGYLHNAMRGGVGLGELVDMLPGRLARTRSMLTYTTTPAGHDGLMQVPLVGGPPAPYALVPIAERKDGFDQIASLTFGPHSGQLYRGIGLIFPVSEIDDHDRFGGDRILIACDDTHTVIAIRRRLQRSYHPCAQPEILDEVIALLGRAHHSMRDATRQDRDSR